LRKGVVDMIYLLFSLGTIAAFAGGWSGARLTSKDETKQGSLTYYNE